MDKSEMEEKKEVHETKLQDLMSAFYGECNAVLGKAVKEMTEADKQMKEYQRNVEQLRTAVKEEVSKGEKDMQEVKQALTELCQSI